MYGNFDAIKSRKKLRKEKISSRDSRVTNLKSRIFRTKYKNVFPELSDEVVENEIELIREKHKEVSKRRIIKNIVIFLLAVAIFTYLISQHIYPFLF